MLEASYFKSVSSAFFVRVLFTGVWVAFSFFLPIIVSSVVLSSIVLVALGYWMCVPSMVSSSLFSGEYSLLVVIRLLR